MELKRALQTCLNDDNLDTHVSKSWGSAPYNATHPVKTLGDVLRRVRFFVLGTGSSNRPSGLRRVR